MPTIIDLAYVGLTPFAVSAFLYKRITQGKYKESVPGMLGKTLPAAGDVDRDVARPRAWLHAVSVGEAVAAQAVLRALHTRHPDWGYIASTVTETGQAKARQVLGPHAKRIFYYPLDYSWTVRRFLDVYRPDVYLVHETEIWPNFLLELRRRNIPAFIVNGRLGERSSRNYAFAKPVLRPALAAFHGAAMQTDLDAERAARIGIPEENITVTGNCKFDAPPHALSPAERAAERGRIGWGAEDHVVVAGSTHPGEEELVLAAWEEARKRFPSLRLLLAPRHPERFDGVERLLRERKLPVARASRLASGDRAAAGADIVLLDTIGQLARMFGIGEVALIGGAWNPIGGHNLLEAAAHGIPVIRGPHMHKQPEIVRILTPEDGGLVVPGEGIGAALVELLGDEPRRRELGGRALAAVERNRGSATRTVDFVLTRLPELTRRRGE